MNVKDGDGTGKDLPSRTHEKNHEFVGSPPDVLKSDARSAGGARDSFPVELIDKLFSGKITTRGNRCGGDPSDVEEAGAVGGVQDTQSGLPHGRGGLLDRTRERARRRNGRSLKVKTLSTAKIDAPCPRVRVIGVMHRSAGPHPGVDRLGTECQRQQGEDKWPQVLQAHDHKLSPPAPELQAVLVPTSRSQSSFQRE